MNFHELKFISDEIKCNAIYWDSTAWVLGMCLHKKWQSNIWIKHQDLNAIFLIYRNCRIHLPEYVSGVRSKHRFSNLFEKTFWKFQQRSLRISTNKRCALWKNKSTPTCLHAHKCTHMSCKHHESETSTQSYHLFNKLLMPNSSYQRHLGTQTKLQVDQRICKTKQNKKGKKRNEMSHCLGALCVPKNFPFRQWNVLLCQRYV